MALQHLRSSTADKRPTPAAMSDGQLAMNTNLASPGLFLKDSNGDLVKVGPVHVGTTAPNATPAAGGQAGNSVGEQWLDTSSSRYVFKIWDGTAWRTEDGEFVNVSGDTMTGALGIIAGTASTPGIFFSGDTNTGIFAPAADHIALTTNGASALRINNAGQIGFGDETFHHDYSFYKASGTVIRLANSSSTTNINRGALLYFAGSDLSLFNQENPGGTAGFLRLGTAGTERFRITAAGNVGIGTSAPATALDVNGDITISAQGDLRFADSDSSNWVAFQAPATVASNVTWTLPAADGTTGQVLSTNGTGTLAWASAGSSSADYQEFTSSGTWTKPAGVTMVYVEIVGGGGGGGSGARDATTAPRDGGSGGAGGAFLHKWFEAVDLTSTVTVTIGAGGAGGAGITTDATTGNSGSSGGATSFGAYLESADAGGGAGSPASTALASFRAVNTINAANGGRGGTGTSSQSVGFGTVRGGGGGGGGFGRGANITTSLVGAAGGINRTLAASSTGASAGANGTANEGGGGGGGTYTTATAGMAGGDGGFPGGGGGGGSASDNGHTSGAGGAGGAGVVRIWSW